MEVENYEQQTGFDMGISTLQRINYWIYHCNEYSFGENVVDWRKALKVLFREAYPFMKGDEQTDYKNKMNMIDGDYKRFLDYQNNYYAQRNSKYNVYKPPTDIYGSLDSFDKELRVLLKKKGMLMKEGEDARFAMR